VFKSGSLGVGAVGKVETGIVSVGDKALPPSPPPPSSVPNWSRLLTRFLRAVCAYNSCW
jgi:hypothetical protein